jgi:hypothetical protein
MARVADLLAARGWTCAGGAGRSPRGTAYNLRADGSRLHVGCPGHEFEITVTEWPQAEARGPFAAAFQSRLADALCDGAEAEAAVAQALHRFDEAHHARLGERADGDAGDKRKHGEYDDHCNDYAVATGASVKHPRTYNLGDAKRDLFATHLETFSSCLGVALDLIEFATKLMTATLPGTYPRRGLRRSKDGELLRRRLPVPCFRRRPRTGQRLGILMSASVIEKGTPSLAALCFAR